MYQHAKSQSISSICFGDVVDLKIRLAESILAHTSGTRLLLNMGFVQEHSI